MSKKIVKLIIFSILLIIIFFVFKELNAENRIEVKSVNENLNNDKISNNIISIEQSQNKNIIESNLEIKKMFTEQIPKEYKGYDVEAKLEISKINLETYVLKNYSESALSISVTKYWGCNANEVGNFCIAGHNWNVPNMFNKLRKLKIGDELSLEDNKNGKYNYKIYNIYKVNPNNVQCLEEETNGNIELTMITCTRDSKFRIIVKARKN